MALSALAGGADCGPLNPLQGLSKRFDEDRGLQQDHFGIGKAGSSRETFRTHTSPATLDQHAAHFFSSNLSPPAQLTPGTAYDMSALRAALQSETRVTVHLPQLHQPPANWASDFILQQPVQTSPLNSISTSEVVLKDKASVINGPQTPFNIFPQGNIQRNASLLGYGVGTMPIFSTPVPVQDHQQPIVHASQISWEKEFNTREMQLDLGSSSSQQIDQEKQAAHQITVETDELARTAGLLLDNIKDEQNPKFQNSQFLGLMKKLRDHDVIVEGNQMVENEGQLAATNSKGKGKAFDTLPWPESKMSATGPMVQTVGAVGLMDTNTDTVRTSSEGLTLNEDPNDAYFQQENADYIRYWNNNNVASTSQVPFNAEVTSWDYLQSDWDHFEATATGIKHVDNYQFQDNNPYLVGDPSSTRLHAMHTGTRHSLSESVLQLEAAVQRDMNKATAWFELGIKQQENEREHKALQALQRAVELDPSHLPTWLALAISYTNEGNRVGTYDAVQQWVNLNERYRDAITQFQNQSPDDPRASIMDRYTHLIQCLIAMARSGVSNGIDADIQIALAVLLNTNEDYEKAQDCFRAALAVRPEDWLLYNRVGATLANSGHPEDALQYYHRALELNPGYIRARFNLGISCINLRRYEEAAQHIIDALVLQDNDRVRDAAGLNEKRGVTSTALWDSLKTTCLHMQRVDLATLCDRQDLEAFRINFHM